MANSLTLGGFTFRDFEIPDKLHFGGRQHLGIHELVGGDRVIDRMGPRPEPITWKGRLRGRNASSRARSLDNMRASGAEVVVSWGSFAYLVTVSEFKADYQQSYEIPYHIELTVITDPAAGAFGALATLTQLVASDVASLVSLGGLL